MEIEVIAKIAHRMRAAIEAVPKEELPFCMSLFPKGACGDSSLLLGTYLADSGYPNFWYVCGERGLHSDNSWMSHAWLALDNLVVDITADQFKDAPSPVIVKHDSVWHSQFEIESSSPSDFRRWSGMGIDHLRLIYSKLAPSLFA